MHHAITIHLGPEQQQQLLIMAALVAILIVVAVVAIVAFAVKVSELERDNADLQWRLVTAEHLGEAQAVALRTVDAMARASGSSR
jgi:hypothetical protein